MKTLIKNGTIVNDGRTFTGHILIEDDRIAAVSTELPPIDENIAVIDATNRLVIPGAIDEHVHFREPGLTHKADFESESKAAVAGGVTSFMDMPNVNPQTTTNQLLEERESLAAAKSVANYAFYLGATNNNIGEIVSANTSKVCGIKLFMGSSTGNMLVNQTDMLERVFAESPCIIVAHCEDEQIIKANIERYKTMPANEVDATCHPKIRTAEACLKSTERAVALATKYGARLHVAHLSTAAELALFEAKPLNEKKITAETCPHYLFFDEADYKTLGYRIKCNPSIKSAADREALTEALSSGKIDTIGTDHAPHLPAEKFGDSYFTSASGMPSIQHSLLAMLDLWKAGRISIENVVRKMCHAPADLFQIDRRGYLHKGYKADIVIVDSENPQTVTAANTLYKCGWSPFEGHTFGSTITHTFVNGNLVYCNGKFVSDKKGEALRFNR